ncbi:unnamed protein product [Ectocarpus sp. 12 AP-2014]
MKDPSGDVHERACARRVRCREFRSLQSAYFATAERVISCETVRNRALRDHFSQNCWMPVFSLKAHDRNPMMCRVGCGEGAETVEKVLATKALPEILSQSPSLLPENQSQLQQGGLPPDLLHSHCWHERTNHLMHDRSNYSSRDPRH